MKKLIGISIMFLTIPAFTVENTYDILINRNKITASNWTTLKTKGLKTITDAGGQPFRMFMISSDVQLPYITTNYYRIYITCKDSTEKTYVNNLISAGKITILSEYYIDNREMKEIKRANMPDDYYRVTKSTP